MNPHPSLFKHSLRSFCLALCATLGVCVGLFLLIFGSALLFSDSDSLASNVKILPDAEGHRKELASTVPVILTINLAGEIGSDGLTAKKVEEILLCSREKALKNRVKGVLLAINSPGGGVTDSDIIYHLVKKYKEQHKTPVYAYVEGLCASGGYYIACAADKIYANEASIVGSIGVISWPPFMNVSQLMEKVGVESKTIYSGKGKDNMNPFRPWKEGEQKNNEMLTSFFYNQFVEHVTHNRPKLSKEKLTGDYGAEVFPAFTAMEMGYIDGIYPLKYEVLKELVEVAGIGKDQKYQVITYETRNWWEKMVQEKSPLLTGKVKHELALPSEMQTESLPIKYLYR
jgi:protease-4